MMSINRKHLGCFDAPESKASSSYSARLGAQVVVLSLDELLTQT